MSSVKFYSSFLFSFLSVALYAQENPTTFLDELIIEHQKISNQSKSQRTITLNDSLIVESTGTFTDFLQKNTSIYFKENGYGMVSSPSFRGTTAQQTSVLWNGIKMNSALLGQTDFNSTAFKSYDNIVVKPGGGSVLYGSGAIGGTIHLNNDLLFNKPLTNEIVLSYGSYNTKGIHYKVSTGTEKWAVQALFGYNKSANDYEWIGKNRKNINGQFFNVDFGTAIAYKINHKNKLAFYSSTFADERHFALLTPYQTKTKYQNSYNRNLLKWNYKSNRFLNTFYVAHTQEAYTYFDQLPKDDHSGGMATMWLLKNESFYQVSHRLKLSALLEYQMTKGEGTNSGLPYATQEIGSLSVLANYDFSKTNGIEIGLKHENAKDYQNPFLFSAGYYLNTNQYELKINTSKNYRIPTFNDLYWQPGGNLDLKPENSYQIDINNGFVSKNFNANLSTYYTSITDMIRWVPTNTGFWEANNVDEVTILGAELS
ncbi:MAG TPA: TonB-dependent receptor, partial [Flavobacterium sp.]|nr:TonB-dependent receptor [Flavobacterium sp.]